MNTMGQILRNWRVFAASAFAAGLIIVAYVVAVGGGHARIAEASTETELLQAIAAKDTDGDGLPDWEESLYGTDPTNPDTNHLGMTDGQAVAQGLIVAKAIADVPAADSSGTTTAEGVPAAAGTGTLTDAFAKNFFTQYLAAKKANGGASLSKDQVSELVQKVAQDLASTVSPAPDFKSAANIKTSGSGADAMRAYAISAESVFAAYAAHLPKSELDYLQDNLDKDPTALTNLAKISSYYRDSAAGLSALSVPKEVAEQHLALVNSLARLGQITSDFGRADTDPVATMLALEQYPAALTTLVKAFASIDATFQSEGISVPNGQPGGFFINAAANMKASQAKKS